MGRILRGGTEDVLLSHYFEPYAVLKGDWRWNLLKKGMTVSETFQVVAIIKKLPPSWVDFKNYLKHKRKEMDVEDLIVRLRIEEGNKLAQKNTYAPDSTKANMVEHAGSFSKSNSKAKGKGKKKNDKKGNGKAKYLASKAEIMKQKFQGTCYNCDQPGHRAANCKMPKRVNPRQANMVNDNMDMIAMVSDVISMIFEVNLVGSNNSGWWVDNGQPVMCVLTRGEGDVIMKMKSEKELKLTNVMYVLEIRKNLVSAIDKFVLYKTEVENKLGRKIKVVRSDRGGEYVSSFVDLCVKHGIRHEFTAPYSPQQNGIAERKNRTLKEMVNAMLISSGLSQDMWREAILTATYLLNKIPYIQKNAIIESRNASFFENIFPCLSKESGSSSRLDDEVVQKKRQRDDNDLHDERQDQLELSRYTSNPSVAHWKALTRVLYYLRYNRDYGRHYDRYPAVIEGYSGRGKLLCETWIEVFESNAIKADRNLNTFWWQVTHAFNKATRIVNHTKDMITAKKAGNPPPILLSVHSNFVKSQTRETKKNNLEHAWRILKECSKWDAPDPANLVDLTELFGDDARPRPVGKPRPAEKNKLDGTASTAGSGKSSTLFKLCIPNSSSNGKSRKKRAIWEELGHRQDRVMGDVVIKAMESFLLQKIITISYSQRQEHSFSRLGHSKKYVIQNSLGKVPPSKMIPRRLVLHSLGFVPILFNNLLIAEALEMKEPDVIRSQKLDSGVRIQGTFSLLTHFSANTGCLD
nr:hypothetical protein [Tanacetum cinerariifolium]